MAEKKDWWDKSKVIVPGLTALAAVFGAYFAYQINTTINESNVKTKMIEVSVSILSSPPSNEMYDNEYRAWAIKVLAKYSSELGDDVALPAKFQEALKNKALPQKTNKPSIFDFDMDGTRRTGTPGASEAK